MCVSVFLPFCLRVCMSVFLLLLCVCLCLSPCPSLSLSPVVGEREGERLLCPPSPFPLPPSLPPPRFPFFSLSRSHTHTPSSSPPSSRVGDARGQVLLAAVAVAGLKEREWRGREGKPVGIRQMPLPRSSKRPPNSTSGSSEAGNDDDGESESARAPRRCARVVRVSRPAPLVSPPFLLSQGGLHDRHEPRIGRAVVGEGGGTADGVECVRLERKSLADMDMPRREGACHHTNTHTHTCTYSKDLDTAAH